MRNGQAAALAWRRVLVTGGAGFVGSHLVDELLAYGYEVRVLDNLSPRVHGARRAPPEYLNPGAEFVLGDIRDSEVVRRALKGVDAVFHFAATVGTGRSMFEIEKYMSTNSLGTAVLLEALLEWPVGRLIIASGMGVYGEGLYRGADGAVHGGLERSAEQLWAGVWELYDAAGARLTPAPTPETKPPTQCSIYALSKYGQERLCLLAGRAYNIPTVVLRLCSVYGTRQSLSNPHAGALAMFAARYLGGRAPLLYEDGNQQRDFVSVYDVAQACRRALEVEEAAGRVFNIGSGQPTTIREVCERLGHGLGRDALAPVVTGKCRVGDVRHCFPDIGLARRVLGYDPRITLDDGLSEMAAWLREQPGTTGVGDVSEKEMMV